jgi:hypothetical protein
VFAASPGVALVLKKDFANERAFGSSISGENESIRSGVDMKAMFVGLV